MNMNKPAGMTPGMTEISFVAVNYNSASAVSLLVADLLEQDLTRINLKIVIADNSPSESELASVRENYCGHPLIRFERMPENLGYFGAAQVAFGINCESRLPDWVIVSNADVRLPGRDFLSSIAKLPPVGVIAPRILSGQTGLDQNPFHRTRPTRARMALNRIIPRIWVLERLLHLQYKAKVALRTRFQSPRTVVLTGSEAIYAPHGAFLILSREYFERGANLDCGAFLFAEEIFLAETCRLLGVQISYRPELHVLHDEHVSTAHSPAIRKFKAAAADYIYRNFFRSAGNRTPVVAWNHSASGGDN